MNTAMYNAFQNATVTVTLKELSIIQLKFTLGQKKI